MCLAVGLLNLKFREFRQFQNCPLPQVKSQMRSFLGMGKWYSRFVPNFLVRAAALTDSEELFELGSMDRGSGSGFLGYYGCSVPRAIYF